MIGERAGEVSEDVRSRYEAVIGIECHVELPP